MWVEKKTKLLPISINSAKTKITVFQSINHVYINLKLRFLMKRGYYIVPSLSTALARQKGTGNFRGLL